MNKQDSLDDQELHIRLAEGMEISFCGYRGETLTRSEKEEFLRSISILDQYASQNFQEFPKINANNIKDYQPLIVCQQKILRLVIHYGFRAKNEDKYKYLNDLVREIIEKEVYKELAAQMLFYEYFTIYNKIPFEIAVKFVDEERIGSIKTGVLEYMLDQISENGFPYELGCYTIAAHNNIKEVYDVLKSERSRSEYRIYALKALAQLPYAPSELMHYINSFERFKRSIIGSYNDNIGNPEQVEQVGKTINDFFREPSSGKLLTDDKALFFCLGKMAQGILADNSKEKPGNLFAVNVNTEIALVSALLQNLENLDSIIDAIKKIPTVMSVYGRNMPVVIQDTHGSLMLQEVGRP